MIIDSLLDTDLYKLTMGQAVLHQFPGVTAKFQFKLRNWKKDTLVPFVDQISDEVDALCKLRFKPPELKYTGGLRFMKPDYIDFLEDFSLKRRYINIFNRDNELNIEIEGPWVQTILFETPVLSIVSETFNKQFDNSETKATGIINVAKKIKLLKGTNVKFADFGTRRRFSKVWQEYILKELACKLQPNFIGTSNVMFAKKLGLTPIGTMAHEWIQAMQALTLLKDSQKFALQKWADEYRGDLGIVLSDCLGFKTFLKDFDPYFAKLYDGCRHDSGNPFDWGNQLIDHYKNRFIDPKTKTAVFSDGLNFKAALQLHNYFNTRIKTAFGIGTNLTNDLGVTPLQIVIKMVECDGQHVAKLSDSPGKLMCNDKVYLKHLKQTFNIK